MYQLSPSILSADFMKLGEEIKKVEEALGEDGRILVRESGTEPVVRVMVEASTDEICNQYVDEVIAVMRAQNLVQ